MNYQQTRLRDTAVTQSQVHVREVPVEPENIQEFEEPVKSAKDLGFMTEVDTDFRPMKNDEEITDRAGSTTKMSEGEFGSIPQNMSSMLELEQQKED